MVVHLIYSCAPHIWLCTLYIGVHLIHGHTPLIWAYISPIGVHLIYGCAFLIWACISYMGVHLIYGSPNRSDLGHVSEMGTSSQTRDDAEAVNQLEVARHIAEHLETLAFLSIRYIEDDSTSAKSDKVQFGVSESPDSLPDRSSNGPEAPIAQSGNSALTNGHSTDERGHSELGIEDTHKLEQPQPSEPNTTRTPMVFRNSIFASFVEDAFDRKEFLPEDCFQKLNTPDKIKMALHQGHVQDIPPESIDFIHREAGRFFAILVYIDIDLAPAVRSLRRYNLTDKFLPISRETIEDNCDKADSDRSCTHESALDAFHRPPWDRVTLSKFHDAQWKFLTPVFSVDRPHLQLEPRCILPFTEVREGRSTPFSNVYRVEIHHVHQNVLPLVRLAVR